jgi:hypothetical protein
MNYSQRASAFPESGLFNQLIAWAPVTVQCTPDSPVLPRLVQVWPNLAKLLHFNLSRLGEFPST